MKTAIRRVLFPILTAFVVSSSALAQTQQYPNRPIEFVVPFAAGGGTDVMARAFADAAQKHLPQTMVVMNKPGASGTIGWSYIAGALPDGYKIAVVTTELAIVPHLGVTKLTYQDLLPIARLNYDPSAITVKADSPFNTVEEFLEAAK
jgi:tripartite-type tricarboxylate transporter receptor subunit TctC